MEQEGWHVLRLPAIAQEDEEHVFQTPYGERSFRRRAGEILNPRRDSLADFEKLRASIGSYVFEAQYQQSPTPEGGAIVKTEWLRYYAEVDGPTASFKAGIPPTRRANFQIFQFVRRGANWEMPFTYSTCSGLGSNTPS